MNQRRVKILRKFYHEHYGDDHKKGFIWKHMKKMWQSLPRPERSMKNFARLMRRLHDQERKLATLDGRARVRAAEAKRIGRV